MIYEELKQVFPHDANGSPTVLSKLFAGAIAGVCGQTVVFPLDTVRRTLQVQHFKVKEGGILYNGMVDCFVGIAKRDGIRGFFRGLWPNLLKVGPSVSISFVTYEAARDYIKEL
jgi:solute carrier family 25 phosphate transporter 23/24/25/41